MTERNGPTDADNNDERIARIEKMLADLAAVETEARRLAEEVSERAQRIARELTLLKR